MKNWRQGSYTVEAAILMGMLLPLLAAVIYLGFYLHDRAYLQNAAYEIASFVSLFQEKSDVLEKAEDKKNELLKGHLLGSGKADGTIEKGSKGVEVTLWESFQMPFRILGLFHDTVQEIHVRTQMKVQEPSKTVIRIHAIKKWKGGGEKK